jgi:hypothetical protein
MICKHTLVPEKIWSLKSVRILEMGPEETGICQLQDGNRDRLFRSFLVLVPRYGTDFKDQIIRTQCKLVSF